MVYIFFLTHMNKRTPKTPNKELWSHGRSLGVMEAHIWDLEGLILKPRIVCRPEIADSLSFDGRVGSGSVSDWKVGSGSASKWNPDPDRRVVDPQHHSHLACWREQREAVPASASCGWAELTPPSYPFLSRPRRGEGVVWNMSEIYKITAGCPGSWSVYKPPPPHSKCGYFSVSACSMPYISYYSWITVPDLTLWWLSHITAG